jgi:hypothetical protein
MHLSTHTKDELKPFGFNPVLLKQDIILHEQKGKLLQCSDLGEVDTSIDMLIIQNMDLSHIRIYHKLKNTLFKTNPQDQVRVYSEVDSYDHIPKRSEDVMVTIGEMGDRISDGTFQAIESKSVELRDEDSEEVLSAMQIQKKNIEIDSDMIEEEEVEELVSWDKEFAYDNEVALNNGTFTYNPHGLFELYRTCIPKSFLRDRN